MEQKLIWFCGIPSSGKTMMAMRLWLELDWAKKKAVLFDDEELKWVKFGKDLGKAIKLLKAEYNIVVSPYPQLLPYKPDLIIWCRASLLECIERDKNKAKAKTIEDKLQQRFFEYWGNYFIDADLILDTYDGTRKTEENIELCWKELKKKMEDIFGNFQWDSYTDSQPDWDSCEPRLTHPFRRKNSFSRWVGRRNGNGIIETERTGN